MEIEITFSKEEVGAIIKAHVLKEFPVNTAVNFLDVQERYGNLIVKIEPKPTDEVPEEKEES